MLKKFIAVTQREVVDLAGAEVRDSLDRRWFKFFEQCDIIPILLPNNIVLVKRIFSQVKFDGVLLTGGGDIKSCGGKDLEREKVEDFLINFSVRKKMPLFAVCRGMQKVQDFFGIEMKKVVGHVSKKQKIVVGDKWCEVNSFHNFGTKENDDKEFEVFAKAKDGVIKAIKHKKHNITAIMWHPERFVKIRKEDTKLFCEAFK